MKISTETLLSMIVIFLLGIIAGAIVFAPTVQKAQITGLASDVAANVSVTGTCTLSLNASSLEFGALAPGASNTEITLNISNTGNKPANTSINGSGWDAGGGNTFAVGKTKFSNLTASVAYGSKVPLTGNVVNITFNTLYNTPNSTYWQVQVPDGQTAGVYNQTITFTMQSC